MHQLVRPGLICGGAFLLAACVSSPQQVSGPWGVGYISNAGPRYSSPWNNGPLVIVEPMQWIDAGGVDPSYQNVTPGPFRVRAARVQQALPADPQPGRGAQTVYAPPATNGAARMAAIPATSPAPPRSARPAAMATAVATAARPGSYAGAWTAVDSAGRSCRIQLSTTTAVDRYRATPSGCAGGLGDVNLWSERDGAVTLYAHERAVAQLGGGPGRLSGPIAGSRHLLYLSR